MDTLPNYCISIFLRSAKDSNMQKRYWCILFFSFVLSSIQLILFPIIEVISRDSVLQKFWLPFHCWYYKNISSFLILWQYQTLPERNIIQFHFSECSRWAILLHDSSFIFTHGHDYLSFIFSLWKSRNLTQDPQYWLWKCISRLTNMSFFTMRLLKYWNGFPSEVIDATSLETFKVRPEGALSYLN